MRRIKQFISRAHILRTPFLGISILILLLTVLAACQTTPHWAAYDGSNQKIYPEKKWQKAQTPEYAIFASLAYLVVPFL